MFRRKQQVTRSSVSHRQSHPDPRVEAELQRILVLRRMATRREQECAHARERAAEADRQSIRVATHGEDYCRAYAARASDLREVANDTDMDIVRIHAEIAERMEALSDDDLLWLDPRDYIRYGMIAVSPGDDG